MIFSLTELALGEKSSSQDVDPVFLLYFLQGFNKALEEIYRVQKTYAMPDGELRASLIAENKEYMVPRYTLFYEKYSNLNFTKNKAKYLKYEPVDVAALLDKFFDASA